jgi:DNA topoisomerase-3
LTLRTGFRDEIIDKKRGERMKRLVLAEKPSVAREIARVLGCTTKNKGYFEGNQYVVTWALGHLVTLAEPEDYDQKYKHWRLEDLPMIPPHMKLKIIRQSSHQFAAVKTLMQRSDIGEMVIATDAGREGELVARWIMALVNWKKPFKRLWISSQTDAAIRDGFANLKPGAAYDNLYDAAACRAEADWLIGLNVTRALTCKFNAQLTAGRVQTPTLAMIVQREKEIREFVPVDYWTIRADFGDYFGDWRASGAGAHEGGRGRIFDHARAEAIAARVRDQSGTIIEVKTEGKSEPPPLAYDLTELQRDANRRLGWSAQKTLEILQALYERHKLVTYPRTDARYITTDIVPTLPARLRGMNAGPYAQLVAPLLQKTPTVTRRFVDDSKVSDHHAIIPTEQPLQLGGLTVEERGLYDLIARRFIAVLYPPYTYDQTTLVTEVKGECFYSHGRVVKSQGWRAITVNSADREEKEEDALPEQTLAQQNRGAVKQVRACKQNKKQTRPPGRYTEATLLTAMENPGKLIEDEELRDAVKQSGLGTPATRAEIIEKLLAHFYIERSAKELVPTSKGIQLVDLVAPALKTPELTARWEQSLAGIAKGKEGKAKFLTGIRQHTEELVKGVRLDSTTVYHPDNVSKTKCLSCGKFMLLVSGKRGKMLVCPDRECGQRQPVDNDNYGGFKSSPNASRINQKLISQYSDQEAIGSNMGELLKAALAKSSDKP